MTEYYIATILSLTLSLLVEEVLGINTGGMVTPGVLALYFFNPSNAIFMIMISLITYLIVEYGLSNIMILFGRRRFTMMLLVALFLKIGLDVLYPMVPFEALAYRGIGAVVPGLLANTYSKQSVPITLLATLATAGVIYVVLIGYYLI